MMISDPNTSRNKLAKVAGFLFLAIIAIAIFGEFYLLSDMIVYDDMAATAENIRTNQLTFRLAVASELLSFAAVVVLAISLYWVLKPANKPLAQLALFWRLGEASIMSVTLMTRFIVALLVSDASYLSGFEPALLHGLLGLFLDAYDTGYGIGVVFFSLGSLIFCYLFFKSKTVPKLLSAWGIFASILVLLGSFSNLALPNDAAITVPYGIPIFLFEVILGLWLLLKGVSNKERIV